MGKPLNVKDLLNTIYENDVRLTLEKDYWSDGVRIYAKKAIARFKQYSTEIAKKISRK